MIRQNGTGGGNCYVIPTRDWKVDRIGKSGDGFLHQDDCDFNTLFDIEKPREQNSFNDCVTHCFNVTRCTHFSYSNNRICTVKNAPALTDREAVGISDNMECGYIPSRLNSTSSNGRYKLNLL